MKQPRIGITGNRSFDPQHLPISYTPQEFINSLQQVGGLPLIIPMGHPETVTAYLNSIDKLLLTGGQDVTPHLYGEEPHPKLTTTNLERDLFEIALIKGALARQMPILAICRGLQIINVALDGTLYQDLSLYPDWQVQHVQSIQQIEFTNHTVTVASDSALAKIVGPNIQVSSYHHQAIKKLADPLKAVAWSTDGLIEAVEWHDDQQKLMAVQWHPELSFSRQSEAQLLFKAFVAGT